MKEYRVHFGLFGAACLIVLAAAHLLDSSKEHNSLAGAMIAIAIAFVILASTLALSTADRLDRERYEAQLDARWAKIEGKEKKVKDASTPATL